MIFELYFLSIDFVVDYSLMLLFLGNALLSSFFVRNIDICNFGLIRSITCLWSRAVGSTLLFILARSRLTLLLFSSSEAIRRSFLAGCFRSSFWTSIRQFVVV